MGHSVATSCSNRCRSWYVIGIWRRLPPNTHRSTTEWLRRHRYLPAVDYIIPFWTVIFSTRQLHSIRVCQCPLRCSTGVPYWGPCCSPRTWHRSDGSVDRCTGTIWKLCEPKQRESGNRTARRLCPSTGWGFGGVIPRNFCNLWANLHSEPEPSWPKWLAEIHTVVDMRLGKIFSKLIIHVWYGTH